MAKIKKHKIMSTPIEQHQEIIAAHKAGLKIEFRNLSNATGWLEDCDFDRSCLHYGYLEYRIKPGQSLDSPLKRAEQILKVRAEYETGKPLQWRYPNGSWHDACRWEDDGRWVQSNWETVLREKQEVRIKPEPQFRPWAYADVSPLTLIRVAGFTECWSVIIGVSPVGVEATSGPPSSLKLSTVDYQTLFDDYEYSMNAGKTWNRCRVQI